MREFVYALLIYLLFQIDCVRIGFNIKNGRNAKKNEFPFIVRLERQIILTFEKKIHATDTIHICTGVALAPTWSLTAGHCIGNFGPIKNLTKTLKILTVIRYGSRNGTTAEVLSTVLHPSFQDPVLKKQNDIGLLHTEIVKLRVFAQVSPMNINELHGQELILAGHRNINSSLALTILSANTLSKRMPVQLLNIVVMRYGTNSTMLPQNCIARRCMSSSSVCPADSGGPLIHSTGIIGVNTISLENVLLCTTANQNKPIGIEIITPTRQFKNWITSVLKRDDLKTNKSYEGYLKSVT